MRKGNLLLYLSKYNEKMNTPAKENSIASFTLNELLALTGEADRQGLMRECIIAHSQTPMEAFRFPCRIAAFIIGVGTEGETSISFNLREYRLRKDSLFFFGSKNILQLTSDENFKAHFIAITPDFLNRINVDAKHITPLFLQFAYHPCLELSSVESQTLRSFIALIEQEIKGPETRFSDDIVSGLIAATLYKVGDILNHYLAEHPELKHTVQNRAEEYFRQFIQLLGEHFKFERSVGFYARKLCVTPKYLTTLIKRVSGKSVSEWIDNYVILEAKTLLRFSDMSIQEVAYALNFPNQSFFGSYFRRLTGISPTQYKSEK